MKTKNYTGRLLNILRFILQECGDNYCDKTRGQLSTFQSINTWLNLAFLQTSVFWTSSPKAERNQTPSGFQRANKSRQYRNVSPVSDSSVAVRWMDWVKPKHIRLQPCFSKLGSERAEEASVVPEVWSADQELSAVLERLGILGVWSYQRFKTHIC